MAAPMRTGSQDAATGHRTRVADPPTAAASGVVVGSGSRTTTAKADLQTVPGGNAGVTASTAAQAAVQQSQQATSNFEYDDNEWDIGIGNLIIDLDADIEKTNEGAATTTAHHQIHQAQQAMATNAGAPGSGKTAAKMAIEHSATVDKGLKMKIKRTKPGTKTSEAKHEIVKSNEQNGSVEGVELQQNQKPGSKHPNAPSGPQNNTPANTNSGSGGGNSKRGSSGHRRDKTRDKHSSSSSSSTDKPAQNNANSNNNKVSGGGISNNNAGSVQVTEVNGLVRLGSGPSQQSGPQRPVFPASTGPGPPQGQTVPQVNAAPPASPANSTAAQQVVPKQEPGVNKIVTNTSAAAGTQQAPQTPLPSEENSSSPPPTKKLKTEPKEVTDVCVGTSVGTITEPDCLGPCEPGTSVTLEGIVWHETEGGVLVVNVTWRGKTYVGTLLDCTRHDWAPPRFCDSPTSDLDTRTPKGRETRSSVHSKLRNGGGGVKGRRGAANGSGPSTAPSSPTPFVQPRQEPSNKRKSRAGEEEPAQPVPSNKKTKVVTPTPAPQQPPPPCGSPPPSPVLLECPEPNCSKKYKHINGLKYHQSHAHGSADDDESKDITSMSENDESNIEAPSPATPVKSPEKSQDSPLTPQKKDGELPSILRGSGLLEVPSQPATPRSTPPSPATPQSIQDMTATAGSPTVPIVESKSVVKPGVLRYSTNEEFPVGVFGSSNKSQVQGAPLTNSNSMSTVRAVSVSISPEASTQPEALTTQPQQPPQPQQPSTFTNQIPSQVNMPPQPFNQAPSLLIPTQNPPSSNQMSSQPSPIPPPSPKPNPVNIAQFKVKPAAALMPDDKKDRTKVAPNFKKKSRKSPAGSPNPPESQPQPFGIEQTGRDEVQSPAYSDISDDGAPMEPEMGDKNKVVDKKTEPGQPMPHMPQYGMYPFYGQPPYMVQSAAVQQQQQQENKNKESEKVSDKPNEKDGKKEGSEYQQKVLQQHFYPYGYMGPGYPYNVEPNFGSIPIVAEDKIKEERVKDDPSPTEHIVKPPAPIPNPIQVPNPQKVKTEPPIIKEKHQNENHQILKESIEMKNQMSPYNMYARPQQQQHHGQREEDVRRYYMYDQRRKEQPPPDHKSNTPNKAPPPQSPQMKHKEKVEDKKEKEIKQEGVKPTMETQGPPPPPTSQYAYIHPTYMQSPHYGALPFDPNHPMYRGLMVPGPYSGSYLHPQISRYHTPEDLSRAPPPTKTLDMLQHHAQYYSSHKIHELQERAIKSPTPTKTTTASSSPSTNSGPPVGPPSQQSGPPTSQPSNVGAPGGKQTPGENKESRSPPPQRHVHTHHHTHVGLGYPMYPAPYGAAVLASQQAAAVTVINPYPPK